jgi:hypothetical protein
MHHLASEHGFPVARQVLVHKGHKMRETDQRISEIVISENETIYLMLTKQIVTSRLP